MKLLIMRNNACPHAASLKGRTMPQQNETLSKIERFKRVIAGKPVDRPPVWMMRQAGRYLPEYHQVRDKYDFLTLCRTPEAAAEVSIQPLDILDVDAVIVFNDIVIPMENMGIPVQFDERGPSLVEPVRDREMLKRFNVASFDDDEPVFHTLSLIRERIGSEVPLFGFAGSPFTLACYAIEGNLTRNLDYLKAMRYRDPALLHEILDRLAETVADYLRLQIKAGVDMVQLFDSWGGFLSLADYREFSLPYIKKIFDAIRPLGVPMALYINGGSPMLDALAQSGADVLSVDWRLPLPEVRRRVGPGFVLQGNLDPTALYAQPEEVARLTREMLEGMSGDSRFIANLGHGILPKTKVESARAFILAVKGAPVS
jgi:uroporphyrinogen decarboxylase